MLTISCSGRLRCKPAGEVDLRNVAIEKVAVAVATVASPVRDPLYNKGGTL